MRSRWLASQGRVLSDLIFLGLEGPHCLGLWMRSVCLHAMLGVGLLRYPTGQSNGNHNTWHRRPDKSHVKTRTHGGEAGVYCLLLTHEALCEDA